jgi:hypothetical protein
MRTSSRTLKAASLRPALAPAGLRSNRSAGRLEPEHRSALCATPRSPAEPAGWARAPSREVFMSCLRTLPGGIFRADAPKCPPATKLLVFAPKASTAWAGNFHGTHDAIIITVPSLGGRNFPGNRHSAQRRLRAGLRLGHRILLCPHIHDTIPKRAPCVAEPRLDGTGRAYKSAVNGPYVLR